MRFNEFFPKLRIQNNKAAIAIAEKKAQGAAEGMFAAQQKESATQLNFPGKYASR
jgi:hypothetical protein